MGMMYQVVTSALQDAGLFDQYHPQDYLNFYCLGNREAPSSSQPHQPTDNRGLVYLCFHSGKLASSQFTIAQYEIRLTDSDGSHIKQFAMSLTFFSPVNSC